VPLSRSTWLRKVGSSLVNRAIALPRFSLDFSSFGITARLITGKGTCIEVIAQRTPSEQNVSPDSQGTPNSATMSPASARSISSIWCACMRTSRPMRSRLPVRALTTESLRAIFPWYNRT
jgi:hypothetical protein